MIRRVNRGYGGTLKSPRESEGYNRSLVVLDSDGQHDARYTEITLIMNDDADFVIGSRFIDGGELLIPAC